MPVLTPEAWAQVRRDYEHTGRTIHEICAEHGFSTGTLRDRVRRWKWTRRRAPIQSDGPPPLPAPQVAAPPADAVAPPAEAEAARLPSVAPDVAVVIAGAAAPHVAAEDIGAPPDPAVVARRLQAALARVLPAVEAVLTQLAAASAHPREMEIAARSLGSLTRALRELNALLGRYPAPGEEPPDIEEFRRDLARRIDAIIASGGGNETA